MQVIQVSENSSTHKVKEALRVVEWVNLYLLEHTSKDFQTEIFLVS